MIEAVVETGELADVEDLDVAALDVLEGGDGGLLQFVKSHPSGSNRDGVGQYRPKQQAGANRRPPIGPCPRVQVARESPSPRWAAAIPAPRKWRRQARKTRPQGRGSDALRHSAASSSGRSAVSGTPGRATTTTCARSKISRHRCQVGSPRKASAPSSSTQRPLRCLAAQLLERQHGVAFAVAPQFALVDHEPGNSRDGETKHREPIRGRWPPVRHDAADRGPGAGAPRRARARGARRRRGADGRSAPGRTCRPATRSGRDSPSAVTAQCASARRTIPHHRFPSRSTAPFRR